MAADGINISTEEVQNIAGKIKSINEALNSRLEDINLQMTSLNNTWQSEAANAIQEKFKGMLPIFENYKKIVESYAIFLENTAASYQKTDTIIQTNASAFQ